MGIGVIIGMDSPACLPAWIECMMGEMERGGVRKGEEPIWMYAGHPYHAFVKYAPKRSHKIPKMSQYEDSLNAHFVFPHVCKFMCMIYPMPYVRIYREEALRCLPLNLTSFAK